MKSSHIKRILARIAEIDTQVTEIEKGFRMTKTSVKQLVKYNLGEACQDTLAKNPGLFPELDNLLNGELSNILGKDDKNG